MSDSVVGVAGTEHVAATRCLGFRHWRRLRRIELTSGSSWWGAHATDGFPLVGAGLVPGGVKLGGHNSTTGAALAVGYLRD